MVALVVGVTEDEAMAVRGQALREVYPRRYDVPLLLLVSAVLFGVALALPLFRVEKMFFWKTSYSVVTGVINLVEEGEYLLAAVIFFFSIVFPVVKLAALTVIWVAPLADAHRQSMLHWLGVLEKWSMLDVLLVAVIICAAKLEPLVHIEPRVGVYIFGIVVLLSMLVTMHVARLAKVSTLSAASR